MTHCRHFDTTRKGNHSATLIPQVVGRWRPLSSEICAQNDPPPLEKRRLWQISAYNVSTVRDSEKSPIMTNIKSPRAFQRAIDGVRTLPLSALKGGSKSEFFVFWVKVNGWSSQALSTLFAGQCHKHLMVGRNVDHIHPRDLYLAARPSRTNGLIMMRVCQRQRRHLWESLREWLSVPPFTRAFLKSPSSRGLSAIAELLVLD